MAAKTYSRSSIAIFGLLTALTVFLFLGYKARDLAERKLINEQRIVSGTELIIRLDLIRLKMSQLEASALGYLATERRSYLKKFSEDKASIDVLWSDLSDVASDSVQLSPLKKLVYQQDRRWKFLNELMHIRETQGLREAERVLFFDDAMDAYDDLLDSFSSYIANIYSDVLVFRERAEVIRHRESRQMMIGNICAFFILALSVNSLTKQIFLRGEAEDVIELRDKELVEIKDQVKIITEERDLAEEAEQNLVIYNQQLKDKNTDLQRFASLASSDLSNPVKNIQKSCSLLRDVIDLDELSEDALSHIDDIAKDAGKMERVLVSLKDYSRVNSKLNPFVEIHLDTVFKSAMFNFRKEVDEHKIEINADNLGVVEGDLAQITQLFTHLLSNSIKFYRKDEQRKITVSSINMMWESEFENHSKKEVCCITFEDNGIGFNERFKDKIFAPFETLKTWHNYDSPGMGLSLSQRIVERHQGYIRAESEVAKGSRFIVVLPLKHNKGDVASETETEVKTKIDLDSENQEVKSLEEKTILLSSDERNS